MKKFAKISIKVLIITIITTLPFSSFSQNPCNGQDECTISQVCKPFVLGNGFHQDDACDVQICIEQTLVCGEGENETQCQSYTPSCQILTHTRGAESNFCYKSTNEVPCDNCNCNCRFVTTQITISKLFSGHNGNLASIILTGSQAQNFMNVVTGSTGGQFSFGGQINDCNGGIGAVIMTINKYISPTGAETILLDYIN
jgi:hypothetical protein